MWFNGRGGPALAVTLVADPHVAAEAKELVGIKGMAGLADCRARFEVSFEDLDELRCEINSLSEVESLLHKVGHGYIHLLWNDEVLRPEDA